MRVVATARLDGNELRVEVNSAERASGVKRVVGLALVDAELVDEVEGDFERKVTPWNACSNS